MAKVKTYYKWHYAAYVGKNILRVIIIAPNRRNAEEKYREATRTLKPTEPVITLIEML